MKPKKQKENKIILKQWVQVFILIAVLVILASSIYGIVKSFNKEPIVKKELYNYSYNSNLDYKVYLKPNQFFTSQFLGAGKQYITSIIDHIDVDARYTFQTSKDLEYSYSYDVVATVKGTYSDSEEKSVEVWSKAYPISNAETKTGTGNTFVINKTMTIDYNKYNQIMQDFKNQFGLSVDSNVDVAVKVNINAGLPGEEKTLQESYTMTLPIPLLKQTIVIKPNYVNSGSNVVYENSNETEKSSVNYTLLIISLAGLVFSLIMFVTFGKKLLATTRKSEYVLAFNKLLKEYGDIIAEADNLPDMDKYDVVNIKLFNDLVDIEEELHSPIICTEIREDLESWFLIFHNDTAYRYVLKFEDMDRFRK